MNDKDIFSLVVSPGDGLIIRLPVDTPLSEVQRTKDLLESRHNITVTMIVADSMDMYQIFPLPEVTYGLWLVQSGAWAQATDGMPITFIDPAVAEAMLNFGALNQPALIRTFFLGGYPLPLVELDKLAPLSHRQAATQIMIEHWDSMNLLRSK